MARTLTPLDAHAIINSMVEQSQGVTSLTATDTSSFVSIGEAFLASGVENTMNALSLVLLRTMIASRPYSGKLGLINSISTDTYSHRLRKISYYGKPAYAAGDWNTDVFTNLAPGFDNGENPSGGTPQSQKSMWEQVPAIPLEWNFGGTSVWSDGITRYQDQVKMAFRDEASFNAFVAGFLQEKANDLEQQKESFRRMTLLNAMAGVYDINGANSVNLTTAFNAFYQLATPLTTQELLSDHLKEFVEYLTFRIRNDSDRLTYRTTSYHWSPTRVDGLELLRHTPKPKQKLFLYSPLLNASKAMVLPEIFNPQYLSIKNYEGVDFWQSFDTPMGMNIQPAVPGTGGNAGTQVQGNAVSLDNVVGFLFDTEALMVDFQLDAANTTPLEARKRYMTTWFSMARNAICDFTENMILYYMAD